MNNILIYGAGAIGRGYLAPLLQQYGIGISFVDTNDQLISELKLRRSYRTAITGKSDYKFVNVSVDDAFLFGEEICVEEYDLVFSCVGPNNCYDLAEDLKLAKAVISCENDMATVNGLKKLTGNPNIYFGIPDVITSNTAPAELLVEDPLMVVTEQGMLVLEKGDYALPEVILQAGPDELHMHWMCKLFIHNAPHAIVAYLGWLKGYTYIHEAMADSDINEVVVGSISEITNGVIAAGFAEKNYANNYKEKELKRFSNALLYDTIKRVAREPLRKIAYDNRLVLGLRIALFNGQLPVNTAKGLKAALLYGEENDDEAAYLQNLRSSSSDTEILKKLSGIDHFDPMNKFITEQDLCPFLQTEIK